MKAPRKRSAFAFRFSVKFLDSLPQLVDAFGAAFYGGLLRARVAAGDGFFAAFTQAALKRIPASTDTDGTVTDHYCIGTSRNRAVRR